VTRSPAVLGVKLITDSAVALMSSCKWVRPWCRQLSSWKRENLICQLLIVPCTVLFCIIQLKKRIWFYYIPVIMRQIDRLWEWFSLPTLFDHLEESFSYKDFQFKTFCQPVKTSCPLGENFTETPFSSLLTVLKEVTCIPVKGLSTT